MALFQSTYTQEVADKICRNLAEGMTLREVCRQDAMPPESTVREWVLDDREGFAAQYARAREIGYQTIADELLEISDDGSNDWMERQDEKGENIGWQLNGEHVQRSRLRLDTRKWLLSKALPKLYGDKITNEHTGKDGGPIETKSASLDEFESRIASLVTRGGTPSPTQEPEG